MHTICHAQVGRGILTKEREPTMRIICKQSPTLCVEGATDYANVWPTTWEDDEGVLGFDWDYVASECERLGIPIMKEGILHNWHAWCHGLKSGWLDSETGWHIFTPCGREDMNDFRLSFAKPDVASAYKMETYTC